MTNGEWLTQKLTEFTDWVDDIKHSKSIALVCWLIIVGCLVLMYTTQSLAVIAVILPTVIVAVIFTVNAITKWLDAEHEEHKE